MYRRKLASAARPVVKPKEETHVAECGVFAEDLGSTDHDERQLGHLFQCHVVSRLCSSESRDLGTNLHQEQVQADLLRHDQHDELVHGGAQEKGDERGGELGQLVRRDRGGVDMAKEERVDGTVPLPRELVEDESVAPVETRAGRYLRD